MIQFVIKLLGSSAATMLRWKTRNFLHNYLCLMYVGRKNHPRQVVLRQHGPLSKDLLRG